MLARLVMHLELLSPIEMTDRNSSYFIARHPKVYCDHRVRLTLLCLVMSDAAAVTTQFHTKSVSWKDTWSALDALLHCNRLRQVARLVHVGAFLQSHVVGQKLQGHGVNNRFNHLGAVGHCHHLYPGLTLEAGLFVREYKQLAAAGAYFFQV
jgi:hypothetical protein